MGKSKYELSGNAILYVYPGGEMDVVVSSDRGFMPEGYEERERYDIPGKEKAKPAKREKGKKSQGEDLVRSMRRARANLRRLALSNRFTLFVTLTLDKEKVDRYDPAAIMKVMNRWLDNQVRRGGLAYVLVPERHKDGALHFHGFFNEALPVVDSGTISRPGVKKPCKPRSEAERAAWLAEGGRIVYNLPAWPLGFSTALELVGEYSAAVGYVCKYIGKQQGERPMGRWYYSGGRLQKPAKIVTTLDYREMMAEHKGVEFEIPGNRLFVARLGKF